MKVIYFNMLIDICTIRSRWGEYEAIGKGILAFAGIRNILKVHVDALGSDIFDAVNTIFELFVKLFVRTPLQLVNKLHDLTA